MKLPKLTASMTVSPIDEDQIVLLGGENAKENHSIPKIINTSTFEEWKNGPRMLNHHFYHGVIVY